MSVKTQVLIVGGGLNGLTMAALLAHHGVRCVLAERHAETSIQYKFAGISPRSMEIFRELCIENEIRTQRTGDQQGGEIARGRTLADPDLQWSGAAWPDASPFSPTQPATCDQHVLEPILCLRAEALGADIRFNTDFLSFQQDGAGVRATLRSRKTGQEVRVEADYLVAADGANGATRTALAIGRHGAGVLQHWMNIIFHTDMPPTLDGRRFTSCFVTDINATLTPREGGRWLLALQYEPDKGERPEDFNAARCRELVMKGAGKTDIRAGLVDARAWEVAAFVADHFQSGRCFIIGDAAHLMPPTGAFGGNSGIHDAHNLAWKIAYVLNGTADESLLDSYDAERRPVIEATVAQSLARLQRWFRDTSGRLASPVEIVPDYDVVFGQRYRDGALIMGDGASEATFADHTALSGEPGTRAPHVPIIDGGKECSTLDLFGRDFVLLGASGDWRVAATKLSNDRFGLRFREFSADIVSRGKENLAKVFGVGDRGAVLVRPDGFVAWRTNELPSDPTGHLVAVLRQLGCKSIDAGKI
jgi:2-polyprenyl-6-methoxyphenol hydroxylase-like FAD-dependent oxidoreductase